VPSGNFGNLTAGLIAKRLGLPVRRFVAATNVNDAVPAYLRSGVYEPRPSVRTVANAMDVGAPSNFERIQALYGGDLDAMRRDVAGRAYDDARWWRRSATCTAGTATCSIRTARSGGWRCSDELDAASPDARGVFLATAHPAKFREVVEPAIGGIGAAAAGAGGGARAAATCDPLAAEYGALLEILRR
jgi:threonine synthase